jgi:hypothetical protein
VGAALLDLRQWNRFFHISHASGKAKGEEENKQTNIST